MQTHLHIEEKLKSGQNSLTQNLQTRWFLWINHGENLQQLYIRKQ